MSRYQIPFVFSLLTCVAPFAVRAQDESTVEPLASILAAEDARRFDTRFFQAIVGHPSPAVRRHAALAMGRIGNEASLEVLVPLLSDPDSSVQRDALFAVGLLRSPLALGYLRSIALSEGMSDENVPAEAVTAIARIGGSEAGALFSELLGRWVGFLGDQRLPVPVSRALGESWRLDTDAPVGLVAQFAESNDPQARWRAVYSLARLRTPAASDVLIRATDDRDALVRAFAVRALDAAYADSAQIDRRGLASRAALLVNDPDVRVRTNALRALGSYGGSEYVETVAARAADGDANVRVQALMSLGQFEGEQAAQALRERLGGGVFATRRQAVESLARVTGAAAIGQIKEWVVPEDWRTRFAAARAFGIIGDSAASELDPLLRDPDPRVVGEALTALLRVDTLRAGPLARAYVRHDDPVIQSMALGYFASHPDTVDVGDVIAAFERGVRERSTRVQSVAVRALGAIAALGPAAKTIVRVRFVQRFPASENYLVREAAERYLPDAAERWGPAAPIETGRSIPDYRDIVREILLPAEQGDELAIVIETDRGEIVVDLVPTYAPLTVNAFLGLVDRRFFDGNLWHRVVPNFVAQDGDKRGDGRGSAGFALRDEVSPLPYERGTMGLARAGPDTGSSQFFLTFSRQPHLEGSYTVFGSVRAGFEILDRVTLGDRIRRIRRYR